MTRTKTFWAVMPFLLASIGIIIGRFGLLTPKPAVFAALAIIAILCVGGIWVGVREGRRAAREGRTLSN
jgi:hypothetical protein